MKVSAIYLLFRLCCLVSAAPTFEGAGLHAAAEFIHPVEVKEANTFKTVAQTFAQEEISNLQGEVKHSVEGDLGIEEEILEFHNSLGVANKAGNAKSAFEYGLKELEILKQMSAKNFHSWKNNFFYDLSNEEVYVAFGKAVERGHHTKGNLWITTDPKLWRSSLVQNYISSLMSEKQRLIPRPSIEVQRGRLDGEIEHFIYAQLKPRITEMPKFAYGTEQEQMESEKLWFELRLGYRQAPANLGPNWEVEISKHFLKQKFRMFGRKVRNGVVVVGAVGGAAVGGNIAYQSYKTRQLEKPQNKIA